MTEKILTMPDQPYVEGGYVLRVAAIRGRCTGQVHQVPIAVSTYRGHQYLVSPTARRPWVRNLLADPRVDLLAAHESERYVAVAPEPANAVGVLRQYLGQLRWAAEQFPFIDTDSDGVIRERLGAVGVFQLEPIARESA